MDQDETDPVAGDLGHAFDAIVGELDKVRRDSEAYNHQLLRLNRELAATAAVAQAISTEQLNLAGTLERTLEVILEVTGLPAGWVMLLPEGGGEVVLASSAGLSPKVAEQQAVFRSPECACGKVLDSRQPLVAHPLHTACPIRVLDLGKGQAPTCHASVPLLTRSKVLGVLNLAGDDPAALDVELLILLGAIGRQLGVAIENAHLWEELKHRDLLRGQLLEQAIAAQEEERRHIARELHDQTGQALTSILVWLRALEAEADGAEGVVVGPARLQEFKALVGDTLNGVHELALELRPSVLDDLGLVPAVQRAVRTCHARHGLAIDFEAVGLEGVRLPPAFETALYRIAQEALTNVIQHACANKVSLLLAARAETVILIVEDDGCGFDVDRLLHGPLDEHWLGLSGMRERAALLGGRLTIESTQGSGTTVFVEIPVPDDRPWRDTREESMASNERIRVLVVDDHAVLRAGLRMLLDVQPDMAVVGEAGNAEQAAALDADLSPDVVLMDLTLPARPGALSTAPSGLEAIRRIKAGRPEARVLALTMHDDEGYLRAVLEAGGAGYVLKRAADTELLSAIRAVWRGGVFLHPEHAHLLLGGTPAMPPSPEAADATYELLSPREQQVLRLVALGHTNLQVADSLGLSVKTVETYKSRLMAKLGLAGRAALVRYALQQGLLEEPD